MKGVRSKKRRKSRSARNYERAKLDLRDCMGRLTTLYKTCLVQKEQKKTAPGELPCSYTTAELRSLEGILQNAQGTKYELTSQSIEHWGYEEPEQPSVETSRLYPGATAMLRASDYKGHEIITNVSINAVYNGTEEPLPSPLHLMKWRAPCTWPMAPMYINASSVLENASCSNALPTPWSNACTDPCEDDISMFFDPDFMDVDFSSSEQGSPRDIGSHLEYSDYDSDYTDINFLSGENINDEIHTNCVIATG